LDDQLVAAVCVGTLVSEHCSEFFRREGRDHAIGDHDARVRAGQAICERFGMFEHTQATRLRSGQQVNRHALPSQISLNANRRRSEHTSEPREEQRGEDEGREVEQIPVPTERSQAHEHECTDRAHPADQPDRLP
jgi:hypothetical protein